MTGGGYARVDPDRMERASEVFDDAADAVRVVAARKVTVAAKEGDHVWGTDETGQSFSKSYKESSGGIFDSLDAVVELMDNIAKGTAHTAEQYRETERKNLSAVETMGRGSEEAVGRTTSKLARTTGGERREAVRSVEDPPAAETPAEGLVARRAEVKEPPAVEPADGEVRVVRQAMVKEHPDQVRGQEASGPR